MSKSILIIVAHADDEALGCAGTILKHVKNGDKVSIIFMTNGVSARGVIDCSSRVLCAHKAMEILGVEYVKQFDFPDNAMDTVALLDIVQALESVIFNINPDTIYTHHKGDLNIDHIITHKAVVTACRPQPQSLVKNILAFEVLSSTEWQSYQDITFTPNYFVDISEFYDKKLQVVKCYQEEMRQAPHSRSIEHVAVLMKHRGYSIGCEAAEAFMVVRAIN